ncbi:MAG TPA: cyclic nucleotide-binding domain-containing protein [bacterium (Candidatus Stahlbacteria)]|nr:cyclic nucleotide-binding domain-containing protein [Candidatus Stahlbacteria bacterium]
MINPELKNIHLFKYLSKGDLEKVISQCKEKRVPKDTLIFKEGSVSDDVYLIAEGRVEVFLTRGDVIVLLAELGPSSFFGEMALLTERTRSASVKAITDCYFYILTKARFKNIIKNEPRIGVKLLLALSEILSQRIAMTNRNLETYFLISKAIVDNEEFRRLYILAHKGESAPSSNG